MRRCLLGEVAVEKEGKFVSAQMPVPRESVCHVVQLPGKPLTVSFYVFVHK